MATYKVTWTHASGRRDTVRPYLTLKGAYTAAVAGRMTGDLAKPLIQVAKPIVPLVPIDPMAHTVSYRYAP
jgi:hypothetical protein